VITRRNFLSGAAFGAAVAAMPSCVQNAISVPAQRIEHVVLLMQENRSFDHYFGSKPGVRGFNDPDAIPGVFKQQDPPNGFVVPWHFDTTRNSVQHTPSTSHSWGPQHESLNNGNMDRWIPAHRRSDGANAPYVMGYYTQNDIPFHYALADAFTLCDAYHCSVLGPTWPNRMMWMTGMVDADGRYGGPIVRNETTPPGGYRWTTYPERLQQAGVSWKVYDEGDDRLDDGRMNMLPEFAQYKDKNTPLYKQGAARCPVGQFAEDCRTGKLPTVSWIIPDRKSCEHPDQRPADGAKFISDRINAIASNPGLWARTVFVLNYDENDGFFDHVAPPAPPPDAPGEHIIYGKRGFSEPVGAGFRVPCIIVSPWTVGGFVAPQRFDHTSCLRLLEHVTGVHEPNISQWRRNTFGDFTSAMHLNRVGQPKQFDVSAELLLAGESDRLPKPTI
jgi:phospholipase C